MAKKEYILTRLMRHLRPRYGIATHYMDTLAVGLIVTFIIAVVALLKK